MNTGFLGFAVATVLTVYGIETFHTYWYMLTYRVGCNSTYRLRYWNLDVRTWTHCVYTMKLQQYLPFTVLKPIKEDATIHIIINSCNSTYRLRYWNLIIYQLLLYYSYGCNSTYRLRYWNLGTSGNNLSWSTASCNSTYRLRYWNLYNIQLIIWQPHKLQQYLPFTVLKPLRIFLNIAKRHRCNSTYRLRYWNVSAICHRIILLCL